MPDSLHPPFVDGAITVPRQLDRWLDVNPQGGALGRTQTYVVLPVFVIGVVWLGYSEIVGEYHFSASHNFSLKPFVAPLLPNYGLYVSYVNDDNTVVRYRLWSGGGEIYYDESQTSNYTGQLIKHNFRLEIWSTNVSDVVNGTNMALYSSVRGTRDYRYGVDSELVFNQGLCQGQSTPNLNLPFVWGVCAQPTLNYPTDVLGGGTSGGIPTPVSGTSTDTSGAVPIGVGVSGGSVGGLNLPFVPTSVQLTVSSPSGGLVMFAIATQGTLTSDGFDYVLSGITNTAGYQLNYEVS